VPVATEPQTDVDIGTESVKHEIIVIFKHHVFIWTKNKYLTIYSLLKCGHAILDRLLSFKTGGWLICQSPYMV